MVPAATTTPSTNGAPHHVATPGGASDNTAHEGATTASAAPTAPSSGRRAGDIPLTNDDAKAIRNFADFKRRYAIPADKHHRRLGNDDGNKSNMNYDDEYDFDDDDDDTCIGIVYQVYEDLRRIRKWRNVTVAWSDVLGRHYICGTAPVMFDSVFPERRRQTDANNQNGDANVNESGANGNSNESNLNAVAAENKDYTQVVIPIGAFENVSPIQLQSFCTHVRRPARRGSWDDADSNGGAAEAATATQRKRMGDNDNDENRKVRCITLAVVDDDSTAAYYRVFSSFDEIVHPQWKRMKKHHDDDGFTGGAGARAGPSSRGGTNETGAGTSQQQQHEAYEDGLDDSDSD